MSSSFRSTRSPEDLAAISEKVDPIVDELKAAGISVKYDDNDNQRSGWKFAEYELQRRAGSAGPWNARSRGRHDRGRPPRYA